MAIDKKTFLSSGTILVDTREKAWDHIKAAFDEAGVPYRQQKLDYGDYSFVTSKRDFSMSCVIERKANVDELYTNFAQDRSRIEKEFDVGNRLANQFVMLLEGVDSLEALRDYVVPDWQMKSQGQRKRADIGQLCYTTLRSWQSSNRYDFMVEFVKDKQDTATKILELFYYYWRNYSELVAARKFS